MPIAFVKAREFSGGSGTATAQWKDDGTAVPAGALLVIFVVSHIGNAINVPSGFTQCGTQKLASGGNARLAVFYKVAAAGTEATTVVTSTSGSAFLAGNTRYYTGGTGFDLEEVATAAGVVAATDMKITASADMSEDSQCLFAVIGWEASHWWNNGQTPTAVGSGQTWAVTVNGSNWNGQSAGIGTTHDLTTLQLKTTRPAMQQTWAFGSFSTSQAVGMIVAQRNTALPAPPANTAVPVVTGTARVGQILSTTDGTWTGSPTPTYAYQWKRAGVAIGGATANTYTLVHADAGSTITCTVTATNTGGTASATSAATASVTEIPSNTVLPVITGSAVVGQILSCSTGTWFGTPTPTYTYQWKRAGVNIGGATSSTYTLVTADAGSTITCAVTGTNTEGSATATTAATATVSDPPANTVLPAITGTLTVGSLLTCSTGTWTGTPTPTYTYQWKRNGSNIGGATSSTYTLVPADTGQSITCTVTGTNTGGSSSATSPPAGTVIDPPVNTALPAITGSYFLNHTLTCDGGSWTGTPTPTLTYQWKRNGVDIGGATSSTYVTLNVDYGQTLSCRVTATNISGTASATSPSTPIISTPFTGAVPATRAQTPHLAYPFRFAANGHARVLEQDYLEEVANCVQVILKTPSGFRVELPEFGCNEMVFQSRNRLDLDGVVASVTQWEPRADADIVDAQILEINDPSRVKLNVEVHGREGE